MNPTKVKVLIVYYSMYGHVHTMAEAVAEGVREVPDCEVELRQVPELVSPEVLRASGAEKARAAFAHVPTARVEELAEADAIIFGTPTRFGNMTAQMRNFLDQTGSLWAKGRLVGKVGSVFVSTATQHGGQETTALTFIPTLLHHGMIVVGVPYTETRLTHMGEILGGGPYGAGTLASGDGSRRPSEIELAIARTQGRHVAEIARRLKRGSV
jgi:NAD(P)H dehydrogenase (quinone)